MPPAAAHADEDLMQAYAGGDMAAFTTLYDRHAQRIWRYVYRHVGDRAVADDLVQDVWLAVVREATRYEVRARFTTWLFTLAHNRMVDHHRTRKSHTSLDVENEEGQALAETLVANSGYGPVRQIESRQQAQQLLAALDALPLEQREAFVLQAESGMSVAEIAEATGVGMETAKSRLRYARAALRRALEEMA
ncbi:MAG: RNA polymerase sigma factor [Brachymonas sp.]|nr:RNA polymerase sigma factor [Brachymonas sp.]